MELVKETVLDCATGSPFVLDTETLLFGWYMEQTRRETVGTWCFEVLSSMYSHVSEQVSQDALRMYLFALYIAMFSRWRSDCYGLANHQISHLLHNFHFKLWIEVEMLSHIHISSVPLAFRAFFSPRPSIHVTFRWLSSQALESSNSGWQVSSFGRYYNPKNGMISCGSLHPSGYRMVGIAGYKWLVHRVVLITFNGLPPNQETWLVHHKDGDKSNNHLDNLEYVTASQNCLYSRATLGKTRRANSKPVMWRPVGSSEKWKVSASMTEAAEQLGMSISTVSKCCRKISSVKGYEIQLQEEKAKDLPGEVWKPMLDPVDGVELSGRMVSSHGRIISARGVVSRGCRTKMGYYKTHVCVGSHYRGVLVHRLVAYTFLGPPSESHRSSVNHKDLDKSNNALHNLEWVSPAENNAHFRAESLTSKRGRSDVKPVWSRRYGETGRWTWHASMTSAERSLGIDRSAISGCVAGRRKKSGGYEFQAAEPPEKEFLVGEVWRAIDISTLLQDRVTRGF